MKCDELEEMVLEDGIGQMWKCYDAEQVDEAIAELKDKIQQKDFFWEGCGFSKMGFKNTIDVAEYVDKLKQKIEDVQASHYAEMVDAGMRERRLRRALWLARAERAEGRKNYWYVRSVHEGDKNLWSIDGSAVKYIGCIKRKNFEWLKVWSEVEIKCRAKAEEYK